MAACVFYATLLDASPVGLPGKIEHGDKVLADIPDDQAKRLQEIAWAAVKAVPRESAPSSFILGADISQVQEQEDQGTRFSDEGQQKDILTILKGNGFNWIRLRVFVNPQARKGYSSKGYCDLDHTLKMAKRIKSAGMGFSNGNLLDQDVGLIVNAWNRSIIPWWLLLPQGVSGAIKRHGGTGPFKEVRKHGPIPLGGAVLTSVGRLLFKGIIHVAGINMLWRASERSIRDSVRNSLALAAEKGYRPIAFPRIGAGSGGFNQERAQTIMLDELQKLESPLEVTVVVYRRA